MDHFQGHSFDAVVAEAVSLGRQEGDAWVLSFAVFMQGLAALGRGENERAMALSMEAEAAASACGDEVQRAGPLLVLANIAVHNGTIGWRARRTRWPPCRNSYARTSTSNSPKR